MSAGLIAVLWAVWLTYWLKRASAGNKRAVKREPGIGRIAHLTVLIIGVILTISSSVDGGTFLYWLGVAGVAAGLSCMAWAREYLGANWSGAVAVKENHELVRS